ncbi:putative protein without homology [Propionibacterium freudenreichii subsp. shermanii]|nr:putative protein without homology [Propionibacterium freudenreichii subsp. shermanii]
MPSATPAARATCLVVKASPCARRRGLAAAMMDSRRCSAGSGAARVTRNHGNE